MKLLLTFGGQCLSSHAGGFSGRPGQFCVQFSWCRNFDTNTAPALVRKAQSTHIDLMIAPHPGRGCSDCTESGRQMQASGVPGPRARAGAHGRAPHPSCFHIFRTSILVESARRRSLHRGLADAQGTHRFWKRRLMAPSSAHDSQLHPHRTRWTLWSLSTKQPTARSLHGSPRVADCLSHRPGLSGRLQLTPSVRWGVKRPCRALTCARHDSLVHFERPFQRCVLGCGIRAPVPQFRAEAEGEGPPEEVTL